MGGEVPNDHLYAIKTYSYAKPFTQDEDITLVLNEITFLRQLQQCENVAQLIRVYITVSQRNMRISMVMLFAKHGSIHRFLFKKKMLSEE